MTNTTTDKATALRAWAKGNYPLEAAVELLIRVFGGRLLTGPWIGETENGQIWFDVDGVDEAGYLSGRELRVLDIAASLASNERRVALTDVLPGLDRHALELVLAADAHAGGSHEHSNIVIDHEAGVAENRGRLPSLYPWPAASDES